MIQKDRIKCAVIDDEEQARYVLGQLLEQIPEAALVASAADGLSGFEVIVKHQPDLVFLDIQMPGMSGIELVKKLQMLTLKPRIVFVTAFEHYAIEALRLAALDYLLKPVDPEQLKAVFNKLTDVQVDPQLISKQFNTLIKQLIQPEKLRLNTRTGFMLIEPQEIVMVIADGNYSHIKLVDAQSATLLLSIGQLAVMLDHELFFRASRSTLINLKFVRQFDRKKRKILLENKTIVYEASIARNSVGVFERIWL